MSVSIDRVRELRRASTPPERKLWQILHGLNQRGYHFRRQHPIEPYYADFACVKAELVIEADGESHMVPGASSYDQTRTATIESFGFRILRFWNNDIISNPDGVLEGIERYIASVPLLTPTPVPSPSRGGGRLRPRKLRPGLSELAARAGDT